MAVWPTGLYKIKNGSYKETPPNNSIRTNMDVGPAKLRRRTTANVRPISFTLTNLTDDDVETLDQFYVTDTFSGADEFDFTHPRTGDAVKARFIQPPDYSDIKRSVYEIPISLEIMP